MSLFSQVISKRRAALLLAAAVTLSCPLAARADNPHLVTVMTRNMDAGTDLGYILAATDQNSLFAGVAATLEEIQASGILARASRLADEIAANRPDLVALQEVTLWRTGEFLQPPAKDVLYDQLDLLVAELAKRNLHYSVTATQLLLDAEVPVPTAGIDLRMTDRNVVLARNGLPKSQFAVSNVQMHRFNTIFEFGSPLLGQFSEPAGWISMDVEILNSKFRFVNTHLESAGVPGGAGIQLAQVGELLAALATPGMPVILAGDFNANAELGPENTGGVEQIVAAGFTDTWKSIHPGDPGYTWPLFGEDQAAGPATPNERIDLVFTQGFQEQWSGRNPSLLSAERIGTAAPYASDHAGVVVKVRMK